MLWHRSKKQDGRQAHFQNDQNPSLLKMNKNKPIKVLVLKLQPKFDQLQLMSNVNICFTLPQLASSQPTGHTKLSVIYLNEVLLHARAGDGCIQSYLHTECSQTIVVPNPHYKCLWLFV